MEEFISDHGLFSCYEGNKERRTGKDLATFFQGWQDVGSRAGFTSSGPPPPWTSKFPFSIFLHDVWP